MSDTNSVADELSRTIVEKPQAKDLPKMKKRALIEELERRKLKTTGKKDELVERLRSALQLEVSSNDENDDEDDDDNEDDDDDNKKEHEGLNVTSSAADLMKPWGGALDKLSTDDEGLDI
ncbi:hypothetical protein KM043_015796 [Ampulex compressa]|nr:hypothetical protein KM043_015796 [Ampulex compressa]